MTYAIVHRPSVSLDALSLDAFAAAGGVHPQLVTRLVALGLLEPVAGLRGEPAFPGSQLARLARIRRLRAALPLNYAAVGVVLDLLARIDELEGELRRRSWT
ncbi:chaperone modulator CbpM [Dactylosporangium sp. NPDC000555]|uniref:chaperone modulator CbpM n=1 Tax=Dactylosporangium sp. NPDC000555 TaxID=3154260 RepID=UPI0033339E48